MVGEWVGVKATVTCPSLGDGHQQNFQPSGWESGSVGLAVALDETYHKPWEKTHISVGVESRRLLLSEVTSGCFCVCSAFC